MKFKTQMEMFKWIWENRPHVSELTGKPLLHIGNYRWHWQFLHVLPKGSYPSYKSNPDNILLGLPDEHTNQERYDVFKQKQIELKLKYTNEHKIKRF